MIFGKAPRFPRSDLSSANVAPNSYVLFYPRDTKQEKVPFKFTSKDTSKSNDTPSPQEYSPKEPFKKIKGGASVLYTAPRICMVPKRYRCYYFPPTVLPPKKHLLTPHYDETFVHKKFERPPGYYAPSMPPLDNFLGYICTDDNVCRPNFKSVQQILDPLVPFPGERSRASQKYRRIGFPMAKRFWKYTDVRPGPAEYDVVNHSIDKICKRSYPPWNRKPCIPESVPEYLEEDNQSIPTSLRLDSPSDYNRIFLQDGKNTIQYLSKSMNEKSELERLECTRKTKKLEDKPRTSKESFPFSMPCAESNLMLAFDAATGHCFPGIYGTFPRAVRRTEHLLDTPAPYNVAMYDSFRLPSVKKKIKKKSKRPKQKKYDCALKILPGPADYTCAPGTICYEAVCKTAKLPKIKSIRAPFGVSSFKMLRPEDSKDYYELSPGPGDYDVKHPNDCYKVIHRMPLFPYPRKYPKAANHAATVKEEIGCYLKLYASPAMKKRTIYEFPGDVSPCSYNIEPGAKHIYNKIDHHKKFSAPSHARRKPEFTPDRFEENLVPRESTKEPHKHIKGYLFAPPMYGPGPSEKEAPVAEMRTPHIRYGGSSVYKHSFNACVNVKTSELPKPETKKQKKITDLEEEAEEPPFVLLRDHLPFKTFPH